MEGTETRSMRLLSEADLAWIAGGAEETSVYYDIGKAVGEAYAYARLKTTDGIEWVANLW